MNILGIIIAILLFALLISGHEFGHFATAKMLGVKVNEFSIGMGPALWKKQRGDTQYSLRAVPIGGYCKLEGEDGDEEDKEPDPRSFTQQPAWAKILILIAGSFMNVVIGIVIVAVVFCSVGTYTTTIDTVQPESAAAAAGLLPGDKIVYIDDKEISSWSETVDIIGKGPEGDYLTLGIRREGEDGIWTVKAFPTYVEDEQRYIIGITPKIKHSVIGSIKESLTACGMMIVSIKDFFVMLFSGAASSQDVVGVVGVVSIVSEQAKAGLSNVFYMMGLISVNLACMNLLPIPALDGGRILFVVLRKITNGKIGENAEAVVNTIGFFLLMILMVYLVVKDTFQFIL